MPLNLKVRVEVINDDSQYEDWDVINLSDPHTYHFLLLAFGNGIIEEIRVVAETKGGILVFTNLIERLGCRRGMPVDLQDAKLYRNGDVCYPENKPFIFISPGAENGDIMNFDDYQAEVETYIQTLKLEDTK